MSAQIKTDNKLYFSSFGNVFEMKVTHNDEDKYKCAYDNVNMAQIKSYYKRDPRNKEILRAIKFPNVTQCNAIIVTSSNYKDYPFIHTMHAPPGCFGSKIDGREEATLSGNINKFIAEVGKHFPIPFQSCKDKKIDIDIYLIGVNINYSRGTYLKNIFSKLDNIDKINIKIKDVSDKFIISNFDYSEVSISNGNWNVQSSSTHKYLDIYFFMSSIIELKIDGWNSKGLHTEFILKNDEEE
jgi:hypothetical protein